MPSRTVDPRADPWDPGGIILENRIKEAQHRMCDYGFQGPVESREKIIQQLGPLLSDGWTIDDLRRIAKQRKSKAL